MKQTSINIIQNTNILNLVEKQFLVSYLINLDLQKLKDLNQLLQKIIELETDLIE